MTRRPCEPRKASVKYRCHRYTGNDLIRQAPKGDDEPTFCCRRDRVLSNTHCLMDRWRSITQALANGCIGGAQGKQQSWWGRVCAAIAGARAIVLEAKPVSATRQRPALGARVRHEVLRSNYKRSQGVARPSSCSSSGWTRGGRVRRWVRRKKSKSAGRGGNV